MNLLLSAERQETPPATSPHPHMTGGTKHRIEQAYICKRIHNPLRSFSFFSKLVTLASAAILNTMTAIENAPNTNSIMYSPLSALSVAAVDVHDEAIAAGLGFAQFEISLTIVLLKQALAWANHR